MSKLDSLLAEKLYGDILNLPHFTSAHYARMPNVQRAAQFGAFAALTGQYDALAERARHTEHFVGLEPDTLNQLDETLSFIKQQTDQSPTVKLTYFQPDERKEGGEYICLTTQISLIDEATNSLRLANGSLINLGYVVSLQVIA